MSGGGKKKDWPVVGAHYLSRSESAVLIAIGAVLVFVALLLLTNSIIQVANDLPRFMHGDEKASDTAVAILNSVLLVMMTMEIVYTVAVSLESHTLVAEPFLIVGAIAGIRRMLVITATSGGELNINELVEKAVNDKEHPMSPLDATKMAQLRVQMDAAKFKSTLEELALLAATVIALAFAIWILKKAASVPAAAGEGHHDHDDEGHDDDDAHGHGEAEEAKPEAKVKDAHG
jgi:hypothetical protein